jgi:hypothetical protein
MAAVFARAVEASTGRGHSAPMSELEIFERLKKAAAGLPEVEPSTWFGTPSLKVRGKGFCRVKDPDTVVVMVSLDEKEMLLEAAPELYFETDHYRGWPAMLVRIHAISDEELAHRMRKAWLQKAPKTLARTLGKESAYPALYAPAL